MVLAQAMPSAPGFGQVTSESVSQTGRRIIELTDLLHDMG